MQPDRKYVVFKRSEFNEWFQGTHQMPGKMPTPLNDAVVVRTRDVFAGPALHSYASAVLTVKDMLLSMGSLGKKDEESLQEIAEYFSARAMEADERIDKKVPST